WLQAEPVVELHQQDVGGPVEEQLPPEIARHVEAGVVGEVARARVRPGQEDGGAWAILPAPHRLDAERARPEVGVIERERRCLSRSIGVYAEALCRTGVADRVAWGAWSDKIGRASCRERV